MLSNVRYSVHSGFARLPRDVVEAPSVVHEHVGARPAVLAGYAHHYVNTTDPIPADLAAGLANTRHGVGYRLVEDVATALLDLAWHSINPDDEITSVEEFEQQVLSAAGLSKTVPPRYLSSVFRHSLLAGYDATCYAHTWSDVLAAHLHETFGARGGPTRAVGDTLRAVFALGRTDPSRYLELVVGHLRATPLLTRLGITAATV